jgi:hypothetical protein
VRELEKVAEVWPAGAAVNDLFLNFLFLFFLKKRRDEFYWYKVRHSHLKLIDTVK